MCPPASKPLFLLHLLSLRPTHTLHLAPPPPFNTHMCTTHIQTQEFDQLRSQQSPALDAPLLTAPSEALTAARGKARAAVDVLMLTDAPLLFPPGALALAALRSGFRSAGLSCQGYLKHVAQRGASGAAASGQGEGGDVGMVVEQRHQQLLATLAAIDQLGAQQGHVDGEALKAQATQIDRRVKVWKKQLAGGGGAGGGGVSSGPAAVGVTG